MDITNLSNLLTKYADNYTAQAELGEALFQRTSRQEWQETYRRRAVSLSRFYEENELILKDVAGILEEPLTEQTAEIIFQKMAGLFQHGCFDGCIVASILGKLIPFYEETHNYERLVRAYEAAFQTLSLAAARDGYLPLPCYQYAEKILDLKDKYAEIRDIRGRITFFEIYHCICGAKNGFDHYGVERSYQYFQEMLSFWNSETVQKLDGTNKHFRGYVDITTNLWINNTGSRLEQASAPIQETFARLAEEQFGQELREKHELSQYDYSIYENHVRAMILRGKISREEGILLMYGYYKERIAHFSEEAGSDSVSSIGIGFGELTFEETVFLLNAPMTIISWTKQCGRNYLPDEMLKTILNVTHTVIYKTLMNTPGRENEINDALEQYCFSLLPFLRSRAEKEKWLFDLVVYRQLPTYIHSSMVQRLACLIFQEMFRDRPELFRDVSARFSAEELPDFVAKCAIFHDVGKNKIAGIINLQTRAIRDNEFQSIRKHPEHGYHFIYNDPDFARYKDIALGHHKFYNGKGGYPEDFDNTSSPYRSVIDLITICDCMDAATDMLGRNYKKAKTADEVLDEFEQAKGIRYNPDMVDYIRGSEELKQKLRRLVSEERIDIAYEIYSDFIK